MNGGSARVLDLFQGARLTPTQRRIAHSLVQHAPSAAYLSAAEVPATAPWPICDATPEPVPRRLEAFEATAARRHLFEA